MQEQALFPRPGTPGAWPRREYQANTTYLLVHILLNEMSYVPNLLFCQKSKHESLIRLLLTCAATSELIQFYLYNKQQQSPQGA